jgi:hypothetical protein
MLEKDLGQLSVLYCMFANARLLLALGVVESDVNVLDLQVMIVDWI